MSSNGAAGLATPAAQDLATGVHGRGGADERGHEPMLVDGHLQAMRREQLAQQLEVGASVTHETDVRFPETKT